VTFTLPLPPMANRYWRNFRGRMVVSAEARRYKVDAAYRAKMQGAQVLDGELAVRLAVYRKARRGDLDGFLKVALDSLNGIAWHDDRQIVKIDAERHDDKANPRIEITVTRKADA